MDKIGGGSKFPNLGKASQTVSNFATQAVSGMKKAAPVVATALDIASSVDVSRFFKSDQRREAFSKFQSTLPYIANVLRSPPIS